MKLLPRDSQFELREVPLGTKNLLQRSIILINGGQSAIS
jgi:hypothetical protein